MPYNQNFRLKQQYSQYLAAELVSIQNARQCGGRVKERGRGTGKQLKYANEGAYSNITMYLALQRFGNEGRIKPASNVVCYLLFRKLMNFLHVWRLIILIWVRLQNLGLIRILTMI